MADSRRRSRAGAPARRPPTSRPHHDSHGQSVAAWTAVGIMMLGAPIMSIAAVIATVWVFVLGAVVVVIGAIAGRRSPRWARRVGPPGH